MKAKFKTEPSPAPNLEPIAPNQLRRLKWNEVAVTGDYIANGQKGYEPWHGPAGFQAGSFVKAIFRPKGKVLATVTK